MVFLQTTINDKGPKLKFQLDGIEIEGLLDTGAAVTIISQDSWHPVWPLGKVSK